METDKKLSNAQIKKIKKDVMSEYIDLVNQIRLSGPSVNRSSIIMVLLQGLSIIGFLFSIYYFVSVGLDTGIQGEQKTIVFALCGMSLVFCLLIWYLAKMVRTRNRFIIDMSFWIIEYDVNGEEE